jgi:hypothetical protein
MNSINVHNVTKIETVVKTFDTFNTRDLIITNDRGESITVSLFGATVDSLTITQEEVEEPSLFLDILESLKTWGLSSHPDLHKLAFKLAVEVEQGLDIGLNARDLGGAFLWSRTTDGHAYWDAIDVFAQNNRY